MNLKSQIKFYLDARGITAADLSRRSGVSKQTLSLWLGGSEPRKLSQVKLVAEALGVSVDHLCFGQGLDPGADRITELDALLGDTWIGGLFEVRFRRVQKNNKSKN